MDLVALMLSSRVVSCHMPTVEVSCGLCGRFSAVNPLYGDTGSARQARDIHTAGVTQARAIGTEFFKQSEAMDKSTTTLKDARLALSNGARSGIIDSALPALDANTQTRRSLANQAGIDVVNSATFGALSKSELDLALSTGIPIKLGEEELDKYLEAKIKAQQKLQSEIEGRARQLNSGDYTLGEWQNRWAEEDASRKDFDDEYARRFSTDDMDTTYKGWRSEKDEGDKPKRKRRWDYD